MCRKVAYQVDGRPRSIMEAAAVFGFKHAASDVIDACLQRIRCKPGRSAAQRAGALIDAYKHEWGWNQVDCARALMDVLPGMPGKRQRNQQQHKQTGPSDMTGIDGSVWEDLSSLVEALTAHQACQAQAGQEQPKPKPDVAAQKLDPLVEAVVAIEGGHISIHTQTCKPRFVRMCLRVCIANASFEFPDIVHT